MAIPNKLKFNCIDVGTEFKYFVAFTQYTYAIYLADILEISIKYRGRNEVAASQCTILY